MKINDKVKINACNGVIFEIYEASGHKYVNVSLTDPLIGTFPATFLAEYLAPFVIRNKDIECPICGKTWTVTKFGMQIWKDCLQCKKRYEDY